jgi:hypothetical protein
MRRDAILHGLTPVLQCAPMRTALTVVFNLALQVLVAGGIAGLLAWLGPTARPRRVTLLHGWRTLRRVAPLAAAGMLAAALVTLVPASDARLVWEPVPHPVPGLATLVGAAGAGGIVLTLGAGPLERRGRLVAARRRVALGGRVAFLGAALQVVLWGATFFALDAARQRALVAAGALAGQAAFGAMLVGTGGFVALLAALTGKPRPGGVVAAVLYTGGYALLVAAALALVD